MNTVEFLSSRAHTYYMGRMLAGMEHQYCIPMDQYQNTATLGFALTGEKSKRRDVAIVDMIRYPYESC